MSDEILASYEEIPYKGKPWYPTHPDCLATVATLFGMRPRAINSCRVLELGCAMGGNLIPMALALPGSRFVGIDLSPSQVAQGEATIAALGLDNIELKALSIMDMDKAFGPFDYIICHGVYSWVPTEVQDKIFTICAECLTPNGVAYISYNTYPGWHLRGIVREMLGYHTRAFQEPRQRIAEARAFLDFLAERVRSRDSAYSRVVREEVELLRKESDAYLFHEHLENVNYPCYFHEVCRKAEAHGLQFLAEAWHNAQIRQLRQQEAGELQAPRVDRIQREQYLDFLTNRTFRTSLFCNKDVPVPEAHDARFVADLLVSGYVRPTSENPSILSRAVENFRARDGTVMATDNPLLKLAFSHLSEIWPQAVSFNELADRMLAQVADVKDLQGVCRSPGDTAALASELLDCYLVRVVDLHVGAPRFVVEVSERPRASAYARLQTNARGGVTNLWHHLVDLNDFQLLTLRYLDGSRDRSALIDALMARVADGSFNVAYEGKPIEDRDQLRRLLGDTLEPSLRQLARCALLVA
jgi:methyltransferase-like protein/SAM-dependent methyltransferase